MKLSIIIVNWNTQELLAQCLASIYAHPPRQPFEVWVVDNASDDHSAAMTAAQFPQVRLLINERNVGFAAANNQAIRQSQGEYLLLLNPDTEVYPDALSRLIQFLEDNPAAGAVGARLLNGDGTLQHSCYLAPTLARELWRMFHLDRHLRYSMEEWDEETPQTVEVLLGACIMLRREILEEIGLLDEGYFMYSEEVDLCRRISQAGWSIYWLPQAQIVHYGGQSAQQAADAMFLRLYEGKVKYMRKHYGRPSGLVYKGILLAASLSRLALTPLIWLERPAQRPRHWQLARRYWQLVTALPGL